MIAALPELWFNAAVQNRLTLDDLAAIACAAAAARAAELTRELGKPRVTMAGARPSCIGRRA